MSKPLDAVALSPDQASDLRRLLDELTAHHEHVLGLLTAHRAAIASADPAAIERCITGQQAAALRLSELESRRASLVRAVWSAGPTATAGIRRATPAGPAPALTLSFLASRAGEPARTGLLQAARRLRELMTAVSERQRAVLGASESLLGHMQGLIAQVARSLSQTGTYARPGSNTPMAVASALDMTS